MSAERFVAIAGVVHRMLATEVEGEAVWRSRCFRHASPTVPPSDDLGLMCEQCERSATRAAGDPDRR